MENNLDPAIWEKIQEEKNAEKSWRDRPQPQVSDHPADEIYIPPHDESEETENQPPYN